MNDQIRNASGGGNDDDVASPVLSFPVIADGADSTITGAARPVHYADDRGNRQTWYFKFRLLYFACKSCVRHTFSRPSVD